MGTGQLFFATTISFGHGPGQPLQRTNHILWPLIADRGVSDFDLQKPRGSIVKDSPLVDNIVTSDLHLMASTGKDCTITT